MESPALLTLTPPSFVLKFFSVLLFWFISTMGIAGARTPEGTPPSEPSFPLLATAAAFAADQEPPKSAPPSSLPKSGRPTKQKTAKKTQKGDTTPPLGARFAGGKVPIRALTDQYGHCSAMAPSDWVVTGSVPQGTALDIGSPDMTMYAGYSITGVTGLMVNSNPAMFATPETFLRYLASSGGKLRVSFGKPIPDRVVPQYTWLPFEATDPASSSEAKGIIHYTVIPMQADPSGYVLVLRTGQTMKRLWESKGAQAVWTALTIRCTAQLQPPANPGDSVGGTARPRKPRGDKKESSYNMQLGVEEVHDPRTGENYLVSPSKDWSNDGPNGPGYYKRSGNDNILLDYGRSQ